MGIEHVLKVIRCLLIVPFPESSLNADAGKLFMEDYKEYEKRAIMWTELHATPKPTAAVASEVATDSTVDGAAATEGSTDGSIFAPKATPAQTLAAKKKKKLKKKMNKRL